MAATRKHRHNWAITLERKSLNNSGEDAIKKQLIAIAKRSLGGSRGRNWEYALKAGAPAVQEGGFWVVKRTIRYRRTSGHEGTAQKQFGAILEYAANSGASSQFKNPWVVIDPPLKAETTISLTPTGPVKYTDINVDLGEHFDHIYSRESQIKILHSAVVAAKETELQNRYHAICFGPPGCGKSEVLMSFGNMLGEEGVNYLKLDATSTTEAGAKRLLMEAVDSGEPIPPVLIIEEIEKTDEKSLRWLLGLLDIRGEIRKTNFRVGNLISPYKLLCLATANDMVLFNKIMFGALASRFAHQIYFPRPNREVLERILLREVNKIKGNPAWIAPTLEFCIDRMVAEKHKPIDDPRKVVPICLCGREALLTGEYQKALLETTYTQGLEDQYAVIPSGISG